MLSKHRLVLLFGLVAIWCLLSGHYSGLLLSLGGVSCLVSDWFYQKIVHQTDLNRFRFHPLKQCHYIIWLLGEIIKSNIDVIVAIFNRKKLSPQFFDVEIGDLDEMGRVIYANSITLTPGTVTIEIKQTTLHVHALLVKSRDGLLDGKMHAKVCQLTTDR